MKNPVKLIVSSKTALQFKYGKKYSNIAGALKRLKAADKLKGLDTKIVYIDEAGSARAAGIRPVQHLDMKECKTAVDALYAKHTPAYIVILGAQDIIPFQEIINPAEDEDSLVPSDLPYACDAPYSRKIDSFTGPTRVVGRIPDIPGKQDSSNYLETLIRNSINHRPKDPNKYREYFAVTAQVWHKSTEQSLQNIFANTSQLLLSPRKNETTPAHYTKVQLKPLTHFFNCHGAAIDACYYGQKGNNYPEALNSSNLIEHVSAGTVIASECCYGAQLFDPSSLQPANSSIANRYLENGAIGLLGSSTIAYGPADSNALADLITQYFIKSILNGASTGRAFLEARQQFLSTSGPQLDPYELKTLAQFYLLGDPAVQPATTEEADSPKTGNTIANTRANLYMKGISLKNSITPSRKQKKAGKKTDPKQVNKLLKEAGLENPEEIVYAVPASKGATGLQKSMMQKNTRFRTFIRYRKDKKIFKIRVLVVKENNEQILGHRVYESR
jgi:hypothetical protein